MVEHVFLDAEACIALLKGREGIRGRMAGFTNPFATTTPALFEIYCGIEYYRKKGFSDIEIKSISKLNQLEIFSLDADAARKASEIWAELKTSGNMIRIIDILIGAIILTKGHCTILSNDKHFDKIKGLNPVKYKI